MAIHEINFTIKVNLKGLTEEVYAEIITQCVEHLETESSKMSFDELNEMFSISDRTYFLTTIKPPALISGDYYSIKNTEIEAIG